MKSKRAQKHKSCRRTFSRRLPSHGGEHLEWNECSTAIFSALLQEHKRGSKVYCRALSRLSTVNRWAGQGNYALKMDKIHSGRECDSLNVVL